MREIVDNSLEKQAFFAEKAKLLKTGRKLYSELYWSLFPWVWCEYGEISSICLYLVSHAEGVNILYSVPT